MRERQRTGDIHSPQRNVIMGVLDWVFGGQKGRKVPPRDDALAKEIVDRVVAATDKRLRSVAGYEKTLREPALATLAYLRGIADGIPGPVDMNTRAWTDNPQIRALFAKPQDVAATFSRDAGIRNCLARSADPECLAILALARKERQVFAPAQKGDMIQHEVAQTTVSFGDARILAPATDPIAVRVELGKRAIDFLALRALAQMTAHAQERKDLEQERALLKVRLQIAEQGHAGFTDLTAATAVATPSRAALAAKLAENEAALAALASTGLMTRFLDIIRDVLVNPGAHLRLEPRTIALDAMNYRVADEAAATVVLQLRELMLPERPPFAVMLARFPRAELLPAEDALAQAERYL
jgi:hypothetical protein